MNDINRLLAEAMGYEIFSDTLDLFVIFPGESHAREFIYTDPAVVLENIVWLLENNHYICPSISNEKGVFKIGDPPVNIGQDQSLPKAVALARIKANENTEV